MTLVRRAALLVVALVGALAARPAVAAERFGVTSDVGRLELVVVDRPGDALRAVTSANAQALLFDTPVDVREAQREHRGLTRTLRANGVEVLDLGDLFGELLGADDGARDEVIRETLAHVPAGATRRELARYLRALSPPALRQALVAGVRPTDLPRAARARVRGAGEFLLPPLPNHIFTRDLGMMMDDRLLLAQPAKEARLREALHARLVFQRHPRFRELETVHLGAEHPIEMGDVTMLAPGKALFAYGERSRFSSAMALARRQSAEGRDFELVTYPLPDDNPHMFHGDTIFTPADDDTFNVHPIVHTLPATVLTPGKRRGSVVVREEEHLLPAIARAVGRKTIRTIMLPRGAEADAAQRLDAQNMVAVAPGHVIAYAHNDKMNRRLAAAGIQVEPIKGSELVRGRGGPHCLTLPLRRAKR